MRILHCLRNHNKGFTVVSISSINGFPGYDNEESGSHGTSNDVIVVLMF
jgi:hypothetical protein